MNKKSISTNDGLKGGFLKGNPHYDKNGNPLGGIKAVVTDQGGQPVELEGGEAILRKSAMESDKEFVVKGTPKEIASTLNQEFDGRAIGDSEAEILAKYREGGELIKRADGSYSKRGLWDNIRDNIGSGRKPTKEMLRQEALIKEKYYLGGDINGYSVNEFEKYLEDKYNANIDLGDYKKYIYLSKISIPKEIRGLGIGTEIMNEIIAYADNNNRLVTLTPSTDYGATSISRLKEFYKNFGFIENKGRNKNFEISQSMYRVPLNDKYHLGGDMSKHLAPNGKPSNLTHEQWHLVRTPEFKAWFGDWENDSENASKVVDENGEPLVVYHGSKVDFYEFDKSRIKDNVKWGKGFYFTDDFDYAKSYANSLFSKDKNRNPRAFFLKIDDEIEIHKNLSRTEYIVYNSNQIKLADGTNTTFDENNDDIRFKTGGSIKPNFSKMSESEIKEFYDSPEGRKLDAETYSEWKKLVNMSKSELENFYNSEEGKEAGLSQEEANRQGIDSGRESARWIMKMKDIPYTEWTSNMWRWAKKQISFIKRMSGMKGELYDDNGNKTRKHTSLLIWGHNPTKKFAEGGGIESNFKANFELWVDKLNRNRQLPIEFTTSKSIEGVHKDSGYGDSYYIMIFDENWNQYAKLRFSGHSVSNINRVKDEIHNPNISRFYEIVSRAMSKKQQEENPEELIKFKDGGSIEKNKEMEKKEIFYAYTNGKKYEIKAYDNLTYESFTNGSSNGSGSALTREDLKRTLYKKIEGSKLIDGINYIIVKDDILGAKEYDYTDYESVKELTKSLIEKYNNEVDSTGKKNKGTKINIEARIDSLFRLVDENPSKYLQDFIDFNNSLPKSFSLSANLIFEKVDYSSNDNIINYLVETKKNPFDFYNISPYKLPKTKNFKVSPNDKVFMGIHDDFIGNDFLRPIMTGTYFSEKGVVSTNAHILLFTKNRGGEESFEGVYCHTKKCIEESKDGKIEGKFPNYEAVIPSTQDYTKNVNAEYLLTYLKNANKYRLFNSVTHASILYFETSEGTYKIGVNTELLSSCIEAMIELGHKEISLNFTAPNRAITITPRGKTNEDARDLKTDFALCMPVMTSKFRDIDIFMYDLDTNCSKYIYNESIYCFDYEHTERENFKKEVREVKELKEQLKSELAKGTEHEMEHLDTLKKVAEGKLTPEEGVVQTAKTHIKENPEYYEDLQKMELEALRDKLKKQGYNVTIPSGGNRISVMGYGKGYFNAKKQKANSILSTLKINGYNAVSKLDADGYYDFWVYADEPKQDLAKMEMENKEIFTGKMDNGQPFMFFIGKEPKNGYKSENAKEFYNENGYWIDNQLGFNNLLTGYFKDYESMLDHTNPKYHSQLGVNIENEESIPDLIEGLKVLLEYAKGAEKTELENTIEGLKLLLDDEKFEKGGELNNNSMFFEPSKSEEEEEKRIMESQFGKNI